jgi:hypothetical protein
MAARTNRSGFRQLAREHPTPACACPLLFPLKDDVVRREITPKSRNSWHLQHTLQWNELNVVRDSLGASSMIVNKILQAW